MASDSIKSPESQPPDPGNSLVGMEQPDMPFEFIQVTTPRSGELPRGCVRTSTTAGIICHNPQIRGTPSWAVVSTGLMLRGNKSQPPDPGNSLVGCQTPIIATQYSNMSQPPDPGNSLVGAVFSNTLNCEKKQVIKMLRLAPDVKNLPQIFLTIR